MGKFKINKRELLCTPTYKQAHRLKGNGTVFGQIRVCLLTLLTPGYFERTQSIYRMLAPVPLSIFRSNSKFDENSERSSFEYTGPITTIFCTRHDSGTVVTCAKYRCDRICYARVFSIFVKFRIRSKYA